MIIQEKDVKRFLEKVNKNTGSECWEWTASLNQKGYGNFKLNGSPYLTHRVSYEIHKGAIPKGLVVRHQCDNPKCVNPAHLELGSQKDNVRDRQDRGRQAKGFSHGCTSLTDGEVMDIYVMSGPLRPIAEMFKVGRTTVHEIKKGERWSHLTGHLKSPLNEGGK